MLHVISNAPEFTINMLNALGRPLSSLVEPFQTFSDLVMSAFLGKGILKG